MSAADSDGNKVKPVNSNIIENHFLNCNFLTASWFYPTCPLKSCMRACTPSQPLTQDWKSSQLCVPTLGEDTSEHVAIKIVISLLLCSLGRDCRPSFALHTCGMAQLLGFV